MGAEMCNCCSVQMERKDFKRCSGCKIAFYCSKECQKTHWKMIHKALCSTVATAVQNLGESPEKSVLWKKMKRWATAWSPAIHCCLPIALDLANHEWGRYETHVLVIFMESTGLDEDHQSFRVTDAAIKPAADMVKVVTDIEGAAGDPPDLKWPRLRCYFFFKGKDTTRYQIRTQAWCLPNLREQYYDVDKECSHKASRLALPQLLNEINVMRQPRYAAGRFGVMASDPDLFRALMERAKEDNGEMLV